MQILTATDIKAGAEIHNTYGELGTPSLVSPTCTLMLVAWAA